MGNNQSSPSSAQAAAAAVAASTATTTTTRPREEPTTEESALLVSNYGSSFGPAEYPISINNKNKNYSSLSRTLFAEGSESESACTSDRPFNCKNLEDSKERQRDNELMMSSSSVATMTAASNSTSTTTTTTGGRGSDSTSSSSRSRLSSGSDGNSITTRSSAEEGIDQNKITDDLDDNLVLSEFHDPYNHDEIEHDYHLDDEGDVEVVSGSNARPAFSHDECNFLGLSSFLRRHANSFSALTTDDDHYEENDDDGDHEDQYYDTNSNANDNDDDTNQGYVSFKTNGRWNKKKKSTDPPVSSSSSLSLESCWQTTTSTAPFLFTETTRNRRSVDLNGEENVDAPAPSSVSSTLMQCNGISSWSSDCYCYTKDELEMVDGDEPTPESDLHPPRRYYIITTAAIPWMTGTAVNPLLRAAYLSRRNINLVRKQQKHSEESFGRTYDANKDNATVTLVVPWLSDPEDRRQLYGDEWVNKTSKYQEEYIRSWLNEAAHMPEEAECIDIVWYPARYHPSLSSIFALGDLCEIVPDHDPNSTDDAICILEEPEHINYYRSPGRQSWREKFSHVIGIIHTNYKAYAQNHYSGVVTGPLVGALSALMVQAYCDKVIKLSPVLQTYAPGKEIVSNVNAIRRCFFEVPEYQENTMRSQNENDDTPACYFVGKLLFAKGLDKLLALQSYYKKRTGQHFAIDIVGSGPEEEQIKKAFLGPMSTPGPDLGTISASKSRYWRYFRQPIPARFLGRQDHARLDHKKYKIFINPSVTEVLCTTTVEAIAMSKWVICPRHPSNEFMLQFPNCLQYKSKSEFCDLLQYALTHSIRDVIPTMPCSSTDKVSKNWSSKTTVDRSQIYAPLTWEAATDRLVDTGYLSKRDARRRDRLMITPKDRSIQEWHYSLANGKRGDVLRKVFGGGPVAEQSAYQKYPSSISLYSESPSE